MSQPRKLPSQQRSQATVEFILEAATHLFDAEGVGATTNRIAERAGVSIGSVYQYFPNKQALIHELALRHLVDTRARLESILDRPGHDLTAVRTLVVDLTTTTVQLHDSPGQLHGVLREFAPRTPELVASYVQTASMITQALADRLRELGIDDPRGRAQLAFESMDGPVHGTLTRPKERLQLLISQQLSILGLAPTS